MQRNISFHKFVILAAFITAGSNALSFYLVNLSFLPFIFTIFATTAIISTSLALGIRGGFLSALLATILLAIIQPFEAAVYFLITTIFPALLISFIMNLVVINKETNDVIWLPLSSILFNLCAIITVTVILFAIYVNSTTSVPLLSPESFAAVKKVMDEPIRQLFTHTLTDEAMSKQMLEFYNLHFNKLAIIVLANENITSLFVSMIICIYISTNFVVAQSLSPRPLSFWPRDLIMPTIAIPVWLIAIIAANVSGSNYTAFMCAVCVVFAFSLGFVGSGLAFIHKVTLGKLWRFGILVPTYVLLFSGVFSAFIFIILVFLGFASTIRQASRITPNPTTLP